MITLRPIWDQPDAGNVMGGVDGGANSWGVAPTPMQPAPSGQLIGYTRASGDPSTVGSDTAVHTPPPSWVASITGSS